MNDLTHIFVFLLPAAGAFATVACLWRRHRSLALLWLSLWLGLCVFFCLGGFEKDKDLGGGLVAVAAVVAWAVVAVLTTGLLSFLAAASPAIRRTVSELHEASAAERQQRGVARR